MPTYKMKGPDGKTYRVQGPDGATEDQVRAEIIRQNPHLAPAAPEPVPASERSDASLQLENRYVLPQEESAGREFMTHLARPVANLDKWSGALLKKVGIDTGSEARYNRFNRRVEEDRRSGKIRNNSAAALVGDMVGTAPLMLATRNPFLANATGSALTSTAESPTGVMRDAVVGGVTGKLGDAGTRAVGAVVSPIVNPFVRRLQEVGVTPTLGQIIGGSTHRIEDAATSSMLPLIPNAQERSLHDFNKAVLNEGLQNIGQRVPDNVRAGHDSIAWAQGAFNRAYDNLKPRLRLQRDAQFDTDIGTLHQLAQNLPPAHRRDFNRILNTEVLGRFHYPGGGAGGLPTVPGNQPAGNMSGYTFKEAEEILNKEYARFTGNGATPHDRNYADAIRELQATLRDLAERSNPHAAQELQAINNGYTMLTRAEMAGANAREGIFTPSQFRNAVVQADGSVRHRLAAGGNAIGQDLARAAENVLPRTVNDSGTVPRMVVQGTTGAMLFGGGAGAAAMTGINPLGAAVIGAGLLPYTRLGQRVTSAALTRRPAGAQAVRRALQASAPVVGRAVSINEIGRRNEELPEDR